MTQLTIFASDWGGRIALFFASIVLFALVPDSELIYLLVVFGILLILASFRYHYRWPIALLTLFNWTLISFYLLQRGSAGQIAALFAMYAIGVGVGLWQLTHPGLRRFFIGQAFGIALLELFLILRFWPINFASRALVICLFAFLAFEALEHYERKNFTWRRFLPSVLLSLVVLGIVATTTSWGSL